MSERRVIALNYTARHGSRWALLRVGMTWAELRALGLRTGELNYRIGKGDIVFAAPRRRPGPFASKLIVAGSDGAGIRYVNPAQAKVRPCLCCRKPFESEGPGNRLCSTCRLRASDASPLAL